MDWNAIGALGEVIGAAGVIFSLMYLGTQIRSSTKQANADAIYNSHKAQADIVETFGDTENAKLFAKLEKGEPLESYESVQVDFIVVRTSGVFAALQASANSGIVEDLYLEDADNALSIFVTRFHLAPRMWRYIERAHGSVKDGRVFTGVRSAAEGP